MHSQRRFALATLLALLTGGNAIAQTPASTAFTYQGELASAGTPTSGLHDFRFRLFDAADGGTQIGSVLCSDNLTVNNGRFAVTLDFGPAAFTGQKRFLEIEVRADAGQDCADPSGFTLLAPRQELTASPLASFALTAGTAATASNALSLGGQPSSFFTNSANLTGTLPAAVLPSNVARTDANQTFTGQLTFSNPANTFAGSGSGLTNLSGNSIAAGTINRLALDSPTQLGLGTITEDWNAVPLTTVGSVNTGSRPNAVVVSGNYAYVPCFAGNELQIVDISNLAAPVTSTSLIMPAGPRSVAIAGSYAYVTCSSAGVLQVVNIANPTTAVQVLAVPTGIDPNGIVISGNLAYITCGGSNVVQVFSLADPASPALVGSVPTASSPRSPVVSGANLVVACLLADSLQVFSLASPQAPALLSSTPTQLRPTALAVSGTTVLTTTGFDGRLQIFSIANPAAPALLSTSNTGSSPQAVAVSGNLAFVANTSGTLGVYDITNLAAPVQLSNEAAGTQPRGLAVVGNRAFVTDYAANALRIFAPGIRTSFSTPLAASALTGTDASGLRNIPAASLTGTLSDSQLSSNIARLDANQTFTGQLTLSNPANTFAGNGAGLTNLNGSSIDAGTLARSSLSADVQGGVGTLVSDLSLAGSIATGNQPYAVAVSGSFAYVVNINSSTLQVFNISNPAAPTLAATVATGTSPISVAVSGSFAYVVNYGPNTLQVFDISNPAAITLAGSVATGSLPVSVAVSGSFAYVVNNFSNTLEVFNVSNPAAPTLAATVATGTSPISVAVSGSFAYVVNNFSNTLQVFNVSNPAAPTLAGSVATGIFSRSVAASGSFAYVVGGSNTLQVFNKSNPAAPTLAATVATGTNPISVAVSGSFAYVVNVNSSTLQVFNISNPAAPTLTATVATGSGPTSVAVSGSIACVVNEISGTLQVFKAVSVGFGVPLAASSLAGVNGSGLTGVNAASLNGQPASFYTNASNITTGALSTAQIPNLDASKITTGTLSTAQIPNLDASKITTGTLSTAQIPNLDASKISTGTLADARLSSNIALKSAANAFTSTGVTSFAGNLGIGTTTPSTQFALEAVSGSDTQIALTGGPATGGVIPRRTWSIQSSNVTAPQSQLTGSFQIVDRTVGASRMLIDTNGNVGIGTTTPSQRLTVSGNMAVTGSIAKGGGSFLIDHPLDPENKYLYHSFVESPDMMNVYNGNVVTDASGYATITLPDYFEALNRDFRYQITVVGEDVPDVHFARVFREIRDNSFVVKTTPGNLKVSWQVTGIRQDAWANKNRIPNAVDKPASEKGTLLHPEAFGKPATEGASASPAAGGHEASGK